MSKEIILDEDEIFHKELGEKVNEYLNKYHRDDYTPEKRKKVIDDLFRLRNLDSVQESGEFYTPEQYVLCYFEKKEKKHIELKS